MRSGRKSEDVGLDPWPSNSQDRARVSRVCYRRTSRFVNGTNDPTWSSASPIVSPQSSTHAWARKSPSFRRTPMRTTAPRIPRAASMFESATDLTRHCGRKTPNRAARSIERARRRASGIRVGSAAWAAVVGVANDPIGRRHTVPCANISAHCAWINSTQSRNDSADSFLAMCAGEYDTKGRFSSTRRPRVRWREALR
jgi:hypothetical protein